MTGEPQIRTVTAPEDMAAIVTVFQQVWGTTTPIVNVELLRAMAHSGGYVAGVYDHDRLIGASFGFLARHQGEPALHSHVTGILPGLVYVHQRFGTFVRTRLPLQLYFISDPGVLSCADARTNLRCSCGP